MRILKMVVEFFPGRINCIPLQIINVILHLTCLRNLAKTYTGRYRNPQHLYLVNLSAAIVARNLVYMALVVLDWKTGLVTEQLFMLYIINSAAVFTLYVCAVILVTGDRLLVSLLNLRYRASYTAGNARKTIVAVWFIVCVVACSLCGLVLRFAHGNLTMLEMLENMINIIHWVETLEKYEAVLSAVQMTFTITAYILIFIQYSTSRRLATSYNRPSSRPSFCSLFRNSRFSIAVVLVSSFLLLTALPHIVHCLVQLSSEQSTENTKAAVIEMFLYVLRYVADILDALVYVFLYPPVRKLFRETARATIQKLPSRKRSNRVVVSGGIRSIHCTGETTAKCLTDGIENIGTHLYE